MPHRLAPLATNCRSEFDDLISYTTVLPLPLYRMYSRVSILCLIFVRASLGRSVCVKLHLRACHDAAMTRVGHTHGAVCTILLRIHSPPSPAPRALLFSKAGKAAGYFAIGIQVYSIFTQGVSTVAGALDTAAMVVGAMDVAAGALEAAKNSAAKLAGKVLGNAVAIIGPIIDLTIGIYEIAQLDLYETQLGVAVGQGVVALAGIIAGVLTSFFPVGGAILGGIVMITGLLIDLFKKDECEIMRDRLVYASGTTRSSDDDQVNLIRTCITDWTRSTANTNKIKISRHDDPTEKCVGDNEGSCLETACACIMKQTAIGPRTVEITQSRVRGLLTGSVGPSEQRYGVFLLQCVRRTGPGQ